MCNRAVELSGEESSDVIVDTFVDDNGDVWTVEIEGDPEGESWEDILTGIVRDYYL